MPKIPASPADFSAQLREQVGFIRNSCRLFDAGEPAEAKRIATALRILVHDGKHSRSLLTQLGYQSSLVFLSLAVPNKPTNLGPYWGLVNVELFRRLYSPKLSQQTPRPMPFEEWWSEPVLKDGDGKLSSRRDLVLTVADTDGGAHVDPAIDEGYARLSRENY